ncbi:hypothetical protein [Flavobacterium sp.]|uniref:hypothetical protein n=1 Tax=Flavobacterium sp. TaxID=239 RepID=UPI0035B3EB49
MIDFIKLNINDGLELEELISNNKLADLKTFTNNATGEIELYPKYGKYYNMDIKINPKYSKISGSLHKLENICLYGENQNFNDFSFDSLSYQIPFLEETFNLKHNNSLSYLELGFNIKVNTNPKSIIDDNLLMYDCKGHSKDLKFSGNGDYKEFVKRDYTLKIYNKSKQYNKEFNISENILRIELKLKTKRKIQNLGIFCLSDLLDRNNIFNMFKFLHSEFKKLVIIDTLNFNSLPIKDSEKLIKYSNPHYWQRLRTEKKSYKVINRLKKDFNNLLNKHQLNLIHKDLENKLIYKFWQLINENQKELFEPIKDGLG